MGQAIKIVQVGMSIVFAGLSVWFFLPIPVGILNIGNGIGLTVSLLFLACTIYINPLLRLIQAHFVLKAVATGIAILTIACVVYAVIVTILMIAAAEKKPTQPVTLIVLGCKVEGRTPSLMLIRRMDAAFEYLESKPEVTCIAAGGQGRNEDISEAQAIKEYLITRGIQEDRIFLEDQSVNTTENLQNSAALIDLKQLPTNIAIASDFFHQLRASVIAGKLGLESGSVPAHTPLWLLPTYWVREWIGMIQEWFLKA